jgi:hypothetical protein
MGAYQGNQPSGNVSLIGIHPAKKPATQEGNGFAIINVAWRDFDAQQFAVVVERCVQLEPLEPTHRAFAA